LFELGKKLDSAYQEILSPIQSYLPRYPAHNSTEELGLCFRRQRTLEQKGRGWWKPVCHEWARRYVWRGLPGYSRACYCLQARSIEPFCAEGASTAERSENGHWKFITVRGNISRVLPAHLFTCGTSSCRSKPREPPPPSPPRPPFVPLEPTRIEGEVICLVRPFYKSRSDALAVSSYCPKTLTSHCGWRHSGQRPFGIPNDTIHPRAFSLPSLPFPRRRNRSCSSLLGLNRH